MDNKKTMLAVLAFSVVIIILQSISGAKRQNQYLTDEKGNVIGIAREDSSAAVPLRVKAVKDGLSAEESTMIYFSEKDSGQTVKYGQTPQEQLSLVLRDTISDVDNSTAKRLILPRKLEDGTRVYWYKEQETPDYIIILMILPVMLFLYKSNQQQEKAKIHDKKNEILKGLPSFNNQLLILLNCGLIFNDAFFRIAEGYKKSRDIDYLKETVIAISDISDDTNSSLVTVLEDYSKKLGVKEFSKISAIISDNQYKGVNLTEKLESESDILWDQRKKLAEEKGRLAETKLSFPLALLLLVLILITAAPAILEI